MSRGLSILALLLAACVRLYPDGGELLWRYVTAGKILAPPLEIPGEGIYIVISEDRYVHALNERGLRLWTYNLRIKPSSFISVSPDNIIHLAFPDGVLVAINKLGKEIWRTRLDHVPEGRAAYKTDGTMLIRSGKKVTGLTHRGLVKWKMEYLVPVAQLFTDPFDYIYVLLSDGTLNRYDPWGEPPPHFSVTPHVRFCLPAAAEGLFLLTTEGGLQKISWSGDLVWNREYPVVNASKPALLPRKDGVAMVNGLFITALNYAGDTIWEGTLSRKDAVSYVFDRDDFCYILTQSGLITAFHPERGEVALYNVGRNAQAQRLSSSGLLLIGADDWIVYAFSAAPGIVNEISNEPMRPPATSQEDTPLSRYFQALAQSERIEDAEKALDEMMDLVDSGHFMPMEPEIQKTLSLLSQIGLSQPQGRRITNTALSSTIRAKTAQILGKISTPEAHTTMLPMLYYEWDRESLIAIIDAIQTIRGDKEGKIGGFFDALVKGPGVYGRDNVIVLAVVRACESIFQYQAYLPPLIQELLLRIYMGSYAEMVKKSALKALREFVR